MRSRRVVFIVATAALIACSSTPEAGAGRAAGPPQSTPRRGETISVRTTTPPENDCDWIPVADVAAIVGRLAAPPTRADGCRYSLVMPDGVRALREKELRAFE